MPNDRYFEFADGVHVRLDRVRVLESSVRYPRSIDDVETATEEHSTQVLFRETRDGFAVSVSWSLLVSRQEAPFVKMVVLVEFSTIGFEKLFSVSEDGVVVSLTPVDRNLIASAYSTMRGVAAVALNGTPWNTRIPSLRSLGDLLPTNTSSAADIELPRTNSDSIAG